MICFFNKSDLDGRCAGAIVKYKYPECKMIGVDYNDPPPVFEKQETIFVVDFCFSLETMIMWERVHNLVWIDHHDTSIKKVMSVIAPKGLRSTEFAACELTWMFLFPDEKPMPKAVHYLGQYDVWDHKNPKTLQFQYGMRAEKYTDPNSELWPSLFKHDALFDTILQTGEIIFEYQTNQDKIIAAGMAYEAEFEGLHAIVINKPFSNSKVFDSVYDPDKHDIMVVFGVKPGEIKYSLYCTKPEIHVGKLAEKFGGGGHAGAADFYSKTLII